MVIGTDCKDTRLLIYINRMRLSRSVIDTGMILYIFIFINLFIKAGLMTFIGVSLISRYISYCTMLHLFDDL